VCFFERSHYTSQYVHGGPDECLRATAKVSLSYLQQEAIMDTKLNVLLAEKAPDIHTIGPDSSVVDAVLDMNHANIGALVVLEGDRVVGMFTERDVLVRVVAADRDPLTTVVSDVMTRDPVCVTPDMPVGEAMALITERRFRHLPIVQNGHLCGMISSGDLTRWAVSDQKHQIDHLSAYITDTQIHSASGSQSF
jgi:CBS domain-containing protein